MFMDLYFVLAHKHTKKELGQYIAILTSRLVNNPYISTIPICLITIPLNALVMVTSALSNRVFINETDVLEMSLH